MEQKKHWIVVKADRGIPASIIFFKKRKDTLAEERRLRKRMNLDYDDTGLFQVDLSEVISKDGLTVESY